MEKHSQFSCIQSYPVMPDFPDSGSLWSVRQKRLQEMAVIITVSVLFGVLYPLVNREFDNPWAFFNGGIIGLLGGLTIALSEDRSHYTKIRRKHFLRRLVVNTLLYTLYFALIIALVMGITYGQITGPGFGQYFTGPEFRYFILNGDYITILLYALFFCGLVSFSINMSHKVESKVIINIINGKYHQPKTEQRIFLSFDLNNSTTIAEKLGEASFFDFLNHFYLDLTPAIIGTNADIYRYVGDQVTISWPVKSKRENRQYLNTYLLASQQIADKGQYYLDHWGVTTEFKSVFHAGKVVAGEIGDTKRQFVYHGKLFQTMFLVEKLCKPNGVPVLITAVAADLMGLSADQLRPVTQLATEESGEEFSLYTIR